MTTLDIAGIITRVCTDLREKFASKSVETSKQDKLISGTNIKTVNGYSLVGSGDVSVDRLGYERRTNYISMAMSDSCGSSRIWLTSADGTKMVPINTSMSGTPTTTKTLNTRPIDPFGRIMYYAYSGVANSYLNAYNQWDQYHFAIGYSYVKTLTNRLPVYLKCTPQNDGSAVMADVVQALPSTKDGYIYIFLGVAYNEQNMELLAHHPVYYHDGTGIRLWEGAESGGGGGGAYTPDEYPLTTLSGTGTLQFYAFGGTATLMCSGTTPSGAWDSSTLCTIPAGYRPQMTLYFAVTKTGSAVSDSYVQISNDGTVTLQNWGGTQASREYRCTATWAYHSSGLSNASGVTF